MSSILPHEVSILPHEMSILPHEVEPTICDTENIMDDDNSSSDTSQDIKYVKLELNQLRRENKYLRQRLEKLRLKYQGDKKDKLKKQYAILKPEDIFMDVIKELHASREVIDAFGKGRSPNFKIPGSECIPTKYQSDTLAEHLEALAEKEDAQKVNGLIDILEGQHNFRLVFNEEVEEFLEQIVDVLRRTTKAFTTRALKLRKEYQKLRSKVTLVKLQQQKYRMDIYLMVKEMSKFIGNKVKDPFGQQSESLSPSVNLTSSVRLNKEHLKSTRISLDVPQTENSRARSPTSPTMPSNTPTTPFPDIKEFMNLMNKGNLGTQKKEEDAGKD